MFFGSRSIDRPTADFATDEWPNVDGVKDIFFRSCGTGFRTNPHYHVRDLLLTNDPPAIGGPPDTDAPTGSPSDPPTTAAPTPAPSGSPTAAPTEAYWPIFGVAEDEFPIELLPSLPPPSSPSDSTCFVQKERLGITTATDPVSGNDYFTIRTDPWVGGGIRFGCVEKNASWNCVRSCVTGDGSTPDWSGKTYLTFLARVDADGCQPRVSLDGGGWPYKSSNAIALEGSYVDAGFLLPDEWRRVLIPLDDFKTDAWSLTDVNGLYFLTCGTDHDGAQPVYDIAQLAVTNHEDYELLSFPPSSSPTPYVTDDFLLATHRWVHTNWYPILGPDREPDGHTWIVAENDAWPMIPAGGGEELPEPRSVTVVIPAGQSVVYDGSSDLAYDKIIVEGSLTIRPSSSSGSDVSLTVGTIVVEKGGVLDIRTDNTGGTVEINIEGALDRTVDPEEQLLGIVSLEGNLTVSGDPIPSKMASLSETVVPGSDVLLLDGTGHGFAVGGELILPDTQTGLDVSHWNFPNLGVYADQTESCAIVATTAIETVGDGRTTAVTCASPFGYAHTAGSTAAYTTRSVTIRTAPGSTDRGHILHTGTGGFDVRNARVEDLGRTTTEVIDSTVMAPLEGVKFRLDGTTYARMVVDRLGANQIARYALHAHHSLVESRFEGNALLRSPRDGCVAHNSRVHITDNVVVGADGTGIFLEDATETGTVSDNYIIGTGGGSRGGDDGRFSSTKGTDMAHGGFGIWARGKLAPILRNRCEGHFGFAPYAFFVHPNFLEDHRVPDVPGTPPELAGRLLKEIPVPDDGIGLQLQTYGGFENNTAVGTFRVGIDLSYFSSGPSDDTGSILEGATIVSLAATGRGISTTHSRIFTLHNVTLEAAVEDNTITGIWCNNCNGCTLETPNVTLVVEGVETVRGGNC